MKAPAPAVSKLYRSGINVQNPVPIEATPGTTPTPLTPAEANAILQKTNGNSMLNFASGNEVNNGGYETFKYTLPAEIVQAMTEMQVEVKAATDQRTYTLACDFTNPLGCGDPVGDEAYSVSFDGATDNGDGSYTLAFTVTVFDKFALSHTSFSLPEGQTAGGLTETFTAETCVAP